MVEQICTASWHLVLVTNKVGLRLRGWIRSGRDQPAQIDTTTYCGLKFILGHQPSTRACTPNGRPQQFHCQLENK